MRNNDMTGEIQETDIIIPNELSENGPNYKNVRKATAPSNHDHVT